MKELKKYILALVRILIKITFLNSKNLDINSNLRIQLANFTSEELNGKNLLSHNRLSAVASLKIDTKFGSIKIQIVI